MLKFCFKTKLKSKVTAKTKVWFQSKLKLSSLASN